MKNTFRILTVAFLALFVFSCKDDEVALPDNYLAFATTESGLNGAESEIEISLTRPTDVALNFNLTLTASGITYGTQFTTEPAANNNVVALSIPVGGTSAKIKVKPVAGILLTGTERVAFTIANVPTPTLVGVNSAHTLSFSRIISDGSRLTLEGKEGTVNFANTVYADLSANTAFKSKFNGWNLAFTNDANFRVILNSSNETVAIATTKADINLVTLADTASVQNIGAHDIMNPATVSLVDAWSGDLTKTAFAEVSATAASNLVYLVAFRDNKAKNLWYKVKVDRGTNGYVVKYARIGDATAKEATITKNADYNLSFLSFETGVVSNVEPKKDDWDLNWGYGTYDSGLGSPYWFQDFVQINYLSGVEAAEVLTSTVSYENYAEANIATSTFSKTRDAIGSKWRVTSGATAGIRRDRFYVIKDAEGNIYKLNFVSMGLASDGGERGKPVIEYKLVKKI